MKSTKQSIPERLIYDMENNSFGERVISFKELYLHTKAGQGGHWFKIKNESYLHFYLKCYVLERLLKEKISCSVEYPVFETIWPEGIPAYYLDIGIPDKKVCVEIWTSKKQFNRGDSKNKIKMLESQGWRIINLFPEDYDFKNIVEVVRGTSI